MANKTNSKKTQNTSKKVTKVNVEKEEVVSVTDPEVAEEIKEEEIPVSETIEVANEETPDLVPQTMPVGVVNVSRLNVREKPEATSTVMCVVTKGNEVVVDSAESTEDFFKVCTVSGIEGYCMRKFISIP